MPKVTQLVSREAGLRSWSSGTRARAFNHCTGSPVRWAELELFVILEQLTFQQRRQRKEIIAKHVMADEVRGGAPSPVNLSDSSVLTAKQIQIARDRQPFNCWRNPCGNGFRRALPGSLFRLFFKGYIAHNYCVLQERKIPCPLGSCVWGPAG